MNPEPRARLGLLPVALMIALAVSVFTPGCASFSGEDVSEPAAPLPEPKPTPPPIEKPMLEHKVVKGDSLWKLAMDYDASVTEIKQANQLESDVIRVGETLRIPTFKTPPAVGAASAGVTGSVTPGQGTQPIEGAPATPPSLSIGEAPPPAPERSSIPPDVPFFREGSKPQTASPPPGAPPRDLNVPSIVPE